MAALSTLLTQLQQGQPNPPPPQGGHHEASGSSSHSTHNSRRRPSRDEGTGNRVPNADLPTGNPRSHGVPPPAGDGYGAPVPAGGPNSAPPAAGNYAGYGAPLLTQQQINDLIDRRLRQARPDIAPVAATRATHPFTDRLFSVQIPKKVQMNQIPPYTGKGDPSRHVNQFTSSLLGRGAETDHFALMFPSTLSGNASTWFYNLPQRSIDDWESLKQQFEDAYLGERTLLKSQDTLKAVEMTTTLRDYHSRFFAAVQDLDRKPDDGKLIEAFKEGLGDKAPELRESIVVHPPRTAEDLVIKIKRYMDFEDDKANLKARPSGAPSAKPGSLTENRAPAAAQGQHQSKGSNSRLPRIFTALVCPISTIFRECRNQLTLPKARTGPIGKHLERYCEYHTVFGHSTDDCFDLKRAIENLIQQGKLGRYVDHSTRTRHRSRSRTPPGHATRTTGWRDRSRSPRKGHSPRRDNRGRSSSRRPPPRNEEKRKVIHTFAGGPAPHLVPRVYRADVRHKSAPAERSPPTKPYNAVTFDDSDTAGIITPHDDALVVTVEIAHHKVERVLVDGGGSSDILFYQTFRELGLRREQLEPFHAPLIGFAGAQTYTMGSINLPMVLGRGRRSLTLNTRFLVVDAPATYNAIIGRSTINPNKIVASTAHQVMRFPLPSGGTGQVWGDQPSSRLCYVETLEKKNRRAVLPYRIALPTTGYTPAPNTVSETPKLSSKSSTPSTQQSSKAGSNSTRHSSKSGSNSTREKPENRGKLFSGWEMVADKDPILVKTKWCAYHNRVGHELDECRAYHQLLARPQGPTTPISSAARRPRKEKFTKDFPACRAPQPARPTP